MIPDLTTRIEALGGADREADGLIAAWLYESRIVPPIVNYDPELWLERNGGWTDTLDATIVLVERLRPGWTWGVNRDGKDWYCADLEPPYSTFLQGGSVERYAKTPALALLAALLRSLADTNPAEQRGDGG